MTDKAEYIERYIAYLDLLGFRGIVGESSRDSNAFQIAHAALSAANFERELVQPLWDQDLSGQDLGWPLWQHSPWWISLSM